MSGSNSIPWDGNGEFERAVQARINNAWYSRHRRNNGVTEIVGDEDMELPAPTAPRYTPPTRPSTMSSPTTPQQTPRRTDSSSQRMPGSEDINGGANARGNSMPPPEGPPASRQRRQYTQETPYSQHAGGGNAVPGTMYFVPVGQAGMQPVQLTLNITVNVNGNPQTTVQASAQDADDYVPTIPPECLR